MVDIDDLEFAVRLADSADAISTAAFATRDFVLRHKEDGTVVTDVDVRIEETLAGRVAAERRGDAFLGEELGKRGTSRRMWIVDGIDGTTEFASGRSTWGTLVALAEDDEVVLGVASSPGLQQRWWASSGAGAWCRALNSRGNSAEPIRLSVSSSRDEPRASVAPPAGLLDGWRDGVVRRAESSTLAPEASGHGPLLVAGGEIDVSVHLWGGPWDHAPFVVLVEEAGGCFSDLWGGRRLDTGTAIFSNGLVHQRVLDDLAALAPSRPD